ncbi:phenylacetate-CoA ligase [Rhodobium orientis]|uniref:AMP-dependent synthetase n=1 Tax=Rhodobium orientis TaxID=34017 RepID=A0A327JI95_9HYPH|nr:AMP-binding protein [Rhodobium orientis]MBB4302888.1 phenylacetate-CoA ligase [Rhodobium orientis]MBK5949449.1 AMP-dependent synthetase [Rhodobium orientis]RAI26019.1 AMP-dependent synthetase [Rhodobium orientis]
MTEYFDDTETLDPHERERRLFAHLVGHLQMAVAKAPGWERRLNGFDLAAIDSRAKLARLPVLRKSDLMEAQKARPPFGEFVAGAPGSFSRVFMSPGPIWEPQGGGSDPWHGARALFAAGFRQGDVIHNAFAYHLTPGGFILDRGAQALGCTVFPAGVGNTEAQVQAIATLKPVGYTGTPDYLKVLLDKAAELGRPVRSIKRALVSGGALFPDLRQEYADRGVDVAQCYATADLGVIAYESAAREGLIVNEDMIVEIVRPGTGEPVTDGEVGEVVVTNFSPVYPLIRFGTGDLSAVLPGTSPCGRTNMRIAGWMGRADQRTKVKGMFVDPAQIDRVVKRHPEIDRARLEIGRANDQDVMTLKVESDTPDAGLKAAIGETLRDVTKLGGAVEMVAPGTLPNDGKIIADERVYE